MEDHKAEQRKQVQKEIMSLSTAILAGSVIVGVSVLLAANMITKVSGGSQALVAAQGSNKGPTESATIEIEKRADAPSKGKGKVVIEEFSDFQCPFCQNFFNSSYKEILKNYVDTGKVTFIYRHFPLSFHQNAQKAAEASECAFDQGKFWEYHDILFTNMKSDGTGLNTPDLKKYAADLGLNTSQFNSCLDGGEKAEIVNADFAAGQKAGVTGTPTFSINGKKVVGALPFSEFQKVIEEELN